MQKTTETIKELPLVSIIFPTLNSREDVYRCLQSIRELDYPKKNIEIIIWDNASTDGTQNEIDSIFEIMQKEGWKRLLLIENKKNTGAFTSRSELFKLIDPLSRYVLSLDDDVILPADSLRILLEKLQNYPEAGIIGPRTVYESEPDKTAHGAGFVNLWSGIYSDVDSSSLMECDYIIGCCMLIRKEVINVVNGFDRDYYTSHAEVDFCLKTKRSGDKILYAPEVVVKHNVKKGGTRTSERLYYIYRNKFFVIKKNVPFPYKIAAVLFHIFPATIKNIFQSLIIRADVQETKIILLALFDGIINRTGKTHRTFK